MSIIGWEIDSEKLVDKFTVTTPEEFVMKVRFDPDTGKKLPKKQKVLIKPGQKHVEITGTQIEIPGGCEGDAGGILVEELAQKFDFEYEWADNGNVYFGVRIDDGDTYTKIVNLTTKLESIKKSLDKLKLPFIDTKPKFRGYSY